MHCHSRQRNRNHWSGERAERVVEKKYCGGAVHLTEAIVLPERTTWPSSPQRSGVPVLHRQAPVELPHVLALPMMEVRREASRSVLFERDCEQQGHHGTPKA